MILAPIRKGKANVNMPWMITGEKAYDTMLKVMKSSRYRAHAGVYTGVNSAYWIAIESKQAAGILIKNLATIGKRKVKEIKTIIEPELIYPLVRGQDHKAWHVTPSGYILIPTDDKGKTLSHSELKIEYSKTYQYFLNFLEDLANRGGQPYKSKLEPYRKKPIDEAEREAPPFYWLFNVAPALAPYKVMWKYVAGKISGKGEFSVAVAEPVEDEHLGKRVVIPNEKLMLIPFDDRDEAHYVASVLNSPVAQLIVMGYTIETAISTHVLKNVYVPKYKPKDKVHLKLAELSQNAHGLAKRYYEVKDLEAQEELKEVEEEIDKIVAGLYGITDDELEVVRKTLRVLKGEDDER